MKNIDLSKYKSGFTFKNKLKRFLWNIVWLCLAKPFPRKLCNSWKLFLLRLFGAKIHQTADVYSSVRIYAPWNLVMKENSCLGANVDCYNIDKVFIGSNTVVSQKTYLCTASHDINNSTYPLITSPIVVKDQVWIGASAFIGLGVTIGVGAVIGGTASVYKDVEPWTVVGGNPAKFIKKRKIIE